MTARFIIIFFLLALSNAEDVDDVIDGDSSENSMSNSTAATFNNSVSFPIFNVDDELSKISKSCLSSGDHEKLNGYLFRADHAETYISRPLMEVVPKIIGIIEMRAVLGLARPRSWIKYKYSDTSANESTVSTAQEYFDSRESRYIYDALGETIFFKNIIPPAIAFLDKRHPAIRKMFRKEFEKIFKIDAEGRMEKKVIDHLFDKHANIVGKIDGATKEIFRSYKCYKRRYTEDVSRRKFE